MLCKISEVGFEIKKNATFFLFMNLFPVFCRGQVVKGLIQQPDKIEVNLRNGTLSICPLKGNAVRIKFYKDAELQVPGLIFTSGSQTPRFQVFDLPSEIEMILQNMIVVLDKQTGKLSFADKSGKIFLNEKAGSRELVPDSVMGEPCFLAEQSFDSPTDEHLLGLGQFQDGHYYLRNVTRRLTQVNSQISLPFIY
jgi:alpha-D-xyloside xylohydrolase